MKLSFSLSTKPAGKPPSQQPQSTLKPSHTFAQAEDTDKSSHTKEYLTEFDPSKQTLGQSKTVAPIPPIPNSDEWRARKKMKNLDPPVASDDPNNLQFEVDTTSTADPTDSTISYGLNLRNSTTKTDFAEAAVTGSIPKPKFNIENSMLQKLKQDLSSLPDDLGQEEFNGMSVDNFAPALLAGYGWVEGSGIGRNKKDVKVVEFKRRTAKEGLGFVGELPTKAVHKRKEKENAVSNGNEVIRKEESKGRYYVGKDVRIVGGSEMGLKGRIVEVIGGEESLVLKLSRSEEEVTVRVRDVADLGSTEEERCLRKLKDLKVGGSKEEVGGSDRRRSKDSSSSRRGRESRDSKKKSREGDDRREKSREGDDRREELRGIPVRSWLSSHIRVRIVSKDLKRGRLYLQKGEIVDVAGPTTCDISMDNSRELIQGVDQEYLETALPRRGGPVLVLCGRHKGVYGSLIEKDMENGTAVVRDADSHGLINVRLEQIAEYIGDPSDIGY